MLEVVSVEQMRLSDAHTIERYVSGRELMYRAAYGVYLAAEWKGRIAIVNGSGNNGGDGYALSCILKDHGISSDIFSLGAPKTDDSKYYCRLAEEKGVVILPYIDADLAGYDIIVDCILGTGFQGIPREKYRKAIEAVDRTNAYVISVDINSGMDGDTGCAECAVHSDLTVTIGYVKQGLITSYAGNYIQKLVCADIGIRLISAEGILLSQDVPEKGFPGKIFECPDWLDMNEIIAY